MEQREDREVAEGQDVLTIQIVGQATNCSHTVSAESELEDNHSAQARSHKIQKLEKLSAEAEPQNNAGEETSSNQTLSNQETNPADMDVSKKLVEWLKRVEGPLRLLPYDDQTGEKIEKWTEGATIGYGHLITRQEWSRLKEGISEQQAEKLFLSDLDKAVKAVQELVKTKLTQGQFDALVSLTYNIGRGNFASSSILKMINNPQEKTDYSTQEEAFKAWKKSQGKVMKGLVNRRNSEWNIFSKGVYELW
jgi:GH24 family phage-related lysozyme (muramidase)